MYLHTLPAEPQTNSQHSRNQQEGTHDQWRLKGFGTPCSFPAQGCCWHGWGWESVLHPLHIPSLPQAVPLACHKTPLWTPFLPFLSWENFPINKCRIFTAFTLCLDTHTWWKRPGAAREMELWKCNWKTTTNPALQKLRRDHQHSAERSCQTQAEGSRFLPFPELLPVTQQECWKGGFGFSASFTSIIWVTYTLLKWII